MHFAFGWSHLLDRKQQVIINFNCNIIINGNISDKFEVHQSVPQVGHISPLFFNDIKFASGNCKYSLFADDIKIYCIINYRNDCLKLQDYLDKFNNCCDINGISLNTENCLHINFTHNKHLFEFLINQFNLKPVNKIKDLEITLK